MVQMDHEVQLVVSRDTSGAARGVEGEDCLDSNVHSRCLGHTLARIQPAPPVNRIWPLYSAI